jgi:hypothetical protein
MRTPLLDAQLRGTDPTKDPHIISWAQGAMAGLSDVTNYIIDLNAPKVDAIEKETGNTNSGPEGIID